MHLYYRRDACTEDIVDFDPGGDDYCSCAKVTAKVIELVTNVICHSDTMQRYMLRERRHKEKHYTWFEKNG